MDVVVKGWEHGSGPQIINENTKHRVFYLGKVNRSMRIAPPADTSTWSAPASMTLAQQIHSAAQNSPFHMQDRGIRR